MKTLSRFVAKFTSVIVAVLSCFDRVIFKGHLALAALLHAVIGGMAARYFYAHRDERRREAAEKAAGAVVRVLEAGL